MTARVGLSPIQAALVRAFLPGPAGTLRSVRSTEWRSLSMTGETLVIEFGLADAASRKRAFQLAANAPDIEFAVPHAVVADVNATVRGDVLTIEALVIADD